LPSNRKDINVSNSIRHDVDAPHLPSELKRVSGSCLVPSLPSNRKDINAWTVYAVMWTRAPCRVS
jgi:hypothetical protein